MSVNNELLNCISAFLRNETVQVTLDEGGWAELIRKAEEQKLLPMIFEAAGASMPESLCTAIRSRTKLLVARQMQCTQEFLSLYKSLSDAGIRPLVIKGIVCRSVWSRPEHRSSADEDLYIPLSDYPAFHEKMLELGFEAKSPDYKNAHEERYIRSGLLIEGHWELFPLDNDKLNTLNAYTDEMWNRAQTQLVEGAEMTVLDATDHMTFLLLHAYKHFINSGVGIRQLCDIAQWSKHYALDWHRIYDVLRSVHGECFAAAVFDAGERYFGMEYPPHFERADCTALINDALDGGIYGASDMSRKHSGPMTLEAVDASEKGKTGRPLLRTLFPNRSVMEASYPWVKKSAALLPAAWAVRIAKYAVSRGTDNSAAESVRIGNERIELMKYYKII